MVSEGRQTAAGSCARRHTSSRSSSTPAGARRGRHRRAGREICRRAKEILLRDFRLSVRMGARPARRQTHEISFKAPSS